MNLKQHLDKIISAHLQTLTGDDSARAIIAYAKTPEFGDYQVNGVMGAAKKAGRKPRELAAELLASMHTDADGLFDKAEVAGPGFINLFISHDYLSEWANAHTSQDAELISAVQNPETVVVDYSSPNLAKEMHVGHLRGTCIGDAVSRVLEYQGNKVIRQNHFGDWGTQFGMLITHMLDQDINAANAENALSDLETFYRNAKVRFDEDEDFANRARENVVKLQSGDPECLTLWKQFIDISIEHCQHIYDKMGIALHHEHIKPESVYNDQLPAVIATLNKTGLLTEDQGAKCVFLDDFKGKDGTPLPAIVQKKDGGYLYATTDLAAISYRCNQLNAERILYVVDARQSLHFKLVFAIARKAGFAPASCRLEHLSYGTLNGKDGKPFKTRTGGTVKLADLVDESSERAYRVVEAKNPDLSVEAMQHIADVVGISALKYFELSKNRNTDYIFDWDAMLSFEGNTAPYLLYAYARIRSMFRRQDIEPGDWEVTVAQQEEKALALKLMQFNEAIDQVAIDCLPNQLCLYLYELAGTFMRFYEACPVLKADEIQRHSRLGLCDLTARTLKQGLALLGIQTLEQM